MAVDLEQFAQRGFVTIPAAVDPDLVTAWRDGALIRLRDRASEELKDSVPRSEPRDFATLDPARPRTWKWKRATLRGTASAPLAKAAPAVLDGVAQLVGGVGRLRHQSISNYLIMSFPARGVRRLVATGEALGGRTPGPGSYHLDDPGPSMGLEGWRNAVLLVVLFSDIAPGGGGPILACDSPARVARRLALGGADFVGDDDCSAIVRECTDLHEVTGQAGDVMILHPFLLHSPTTNRRRRLRVLANPMLQVSDTLSFAPGSAARSPLERITQSWVG
ncbi:MAG: hypothetical protein KDA24_03390 [Deltaproteobacteria bacterium]|nr:hypothetical protein [Deltaproteobacteria bacterium]